eukprot:scaffold13237_cov124-Isochrysis_galbana.AAC.4
MRVCAAIEQSDDKRLHLAAVIGLAHVKNDADSLETLRLAMQGASAPLRFGEPEGHAATIRMEWVTAHMESDLRLPRGHGDGLRGPDPAQLAWTRTREHDVIVVEHGRAAILPARCVASSQHAKTIRQAARRACVILLIVFAERQAQRRAVQLLLRASTAAAHT